MLTREQARELWGDNFLEVLEEALNDLEIPPKSKRFLQEVGLPSVEWCQLTFELDEAGFPTLAEYAEVEGLEIEAEAEHLWRVGSLFDCDDVCLDESRYGAVVVVNWLLGGRKTWVSSGIELFLEGLYLQAQCWREIANSDAIGAREAFERFVSTLRRIDPVALANEDNWWGPFIKEMDWETCLSEV